MLDNWVLKDMGLSPPLDRSLLDNRLLQRLREAVACARENSSFYREHLPAREISSLADFSSLPFIDGDILRKSGEALLCVPPGRVERIVSLSTSGSTGEPKRVFFTGEDLERTAEYFAHGMAEFIEPGGRVLSLFPGTGYGGLNFLLSLALKRLDTELVPFGYPAPGSYARLMEAISGSHAGFLVGPSRAVAAAARYSEAGGISEEIGKLIKGVLLAGEYVAENDLEDISRIWRCRVNEHYSMTETGFAGAVGCSVPGGYHIWEAGLYYEIIDPQSGQPAGPGEYGEITVTTLGKRAMPFIRYRTGDISRILQEPCPCGSRLRRLERVGDRPWEKKFERPEALSAKEIKL